METIGVITGIIGIFIALLTLLSQKKEKDIRLNINIDENIVPKHDSSEREDNVDKIFSFIKNNEQGEGADIVFTFLMGIMVVIVAYYFLKIEGEWSIIIGFMISFFLAIIFITSDSTFEKALRSKIVELRTSKEDIKILLEIVENYSWVYEITRSRAIKALNKFL